MFNLVMFSTAFVFSITLCRFSYVTSGITNCINSFDFIAAQSAVVVPLEEGKPPYFGEELFMYVVHHHFENNLKQYLTPFDKYTIDFNFGDDLGYLDGTKKEPYRPYSAAFAFNCNYMGFATFHQKKMFIVEVGKTYEG